MLVAVHNWVNPKSMTEPPPDTHAAKSKMVRRIVGLDRPGGMMEHVFLARNRALSVTGSVLGLKLDLERPAGLGNRDNSCYQNSILQGLASLPSFPNYLSACVRAIDMQRPTDDVAHTLRSLIADLNDCTNNGKTIWTPSLLKSMSTWTQQDAQEYFSKILDDVDKSVARAIKSTRRHCGLGSDCSSKDDFVYSEHSQHSDDSGYQSLQSNAELAAAKTLRNPLEGLLAQRVACVRCGHSEGLSMIPFSCLTLSLGLDKHHHDLYERLDAYSKVEEIEGVECPKCTLLKAQNLLTKLLEQFRARDSPFRLEEPLRRLEQVELALEEDDFDERTITEKCNISSQGKVTTTKTKQIVIARPPQSLAIHVNRSVFDPRTFDMIKNSAPVSFPQTLDLGPWCLGSGQDAEEKLAGDGGSEQEQWLLDPRRSMVAGDLSPSRLTGPIYELRAVVTHYGRHENGHYICYRRYPDSEAPESNEASSTVVIDGDKDDGGLAEDQKPRMRSKANNPGWWRLSDHNVSKVDEDVVMSLAPGVFMLFYECVDPSIVLQAEEARMEDAQEMAVPDLKDDEMPSGMATEPADIAVFERQDLHTGTGSGPTRCALSSSTVDELSEPETLDTSRDTADDSTTVTSAPSSVSHWTHDDEEEQLDGKGPS
ncbi:hypothetical protein UVI_02031840 [Ustilaginoidea virens]|nr:hypothetical protein UVI_02031840 [Ustilaginoidea virens]